jgi:molybdopterin-binding protein
VPAKKKPSERQFKVGDRILVNLHRGRIEEATITAIIQFSSVKKLQVDFGKDMTALIDTWQVVD